MGASKKDFTDMREQEYLINATFRVKGKLVNPIEDYLLDNTKLINYKTIPNTEELYQNDETFRKLVKIESNARIIKEKYINDKN
jgi:hypothetical protein